MNEQFSSPGSSKQSTESSEQQVSLPHGTSRSQRRGKKKKILIGLLITVLVLITLAVLGYVYGPRIYKDYRMKQYGEQVDNIRLTVKVSEGQWLSEKYANGFGEPFEFEGELLAASSDKSHIAISLEETDGLVQVIDTATRDVVLELPYTNKATVGLDNYYDAGNNTVPVRTRDEEGTGEYSLAILNMDTLELTQITPPFPVAPTTGILSYNETGDVLLFDSRDSAIMQMKHGEPVWQTQVTGRSYLSKFRPVGDRYYFEFTISNEPPTDSFEFDSDQPSSDEKLLIGLDPSSGDEIFSQALKDEDWITIFSDGYLVEESDGDTGGITFDDKPQPGTFYDLDGREIARYDAVPYLFMTPHPSLDSGVELVGTEILDQYSDSINLVASYDQDGRPVTYAKFVGSANFVSTRDAIPETVYQLIRSSADGKVTAASVSDDNYDQWVKLYDASGNEIDSRQCDSRLKIKHGLLVSSLSHPTVVYIPR
ncbi:MAG: hypothetical protein Q4P05_07560 [Actinomycetaceae bacterium]|nr:hypothetical protein [Actinomycetaceae bacterium]